MSAAPSHNFETRQFPILTRSLPAMWHTRVGNDQAGATERKRKVKCTHVASACTSPEKKVQRDDDVSVPPSLHRRRRGCPTGVSVRQFPPRRRGPYRRPSPHGTTPYLHHVYSLPPYNRVLSLPDPTSSPRRGNSEIHEREPDLPQAVLVSESTTKRRDETPRRITSKQKRGDIPFLETGEEKIIAWMVRSAAFLGLWPRESGKSRALRAGGKKSLSATRRLGRREIKVIRCTRAFTQLARGTFAVGTWSSRIAPRLGQLSTRRAAACDFFRR